VTDFIAFAENDDVKYRAAERFVSWLEDRAIIEGRGDEVDSLEVDPTGRFWLGRLGPKDAVMRQDERADRLEPCAIGIRFRPASPPPWRFDATAKCKVWSRKRATASDQRWDWSKIASIECTLAVESSGDLGELIFGADSLAKAFADAGVPGLSAQFRVRVSGRGSAGRTVEVTFVNTSPEIDGFAGSRFFECSLEVSGVRHKPFELEALADSFRFDRRVPAFGINCGVVSEGDRLRTTDSPSQSRARPRYWAVADKEPDFRFLALAENPLVGTECLHDAFATWASEAWSSDTLRARASEEQWSSAMRAEATRAKEDFDHELARIKRGHDLLRHNRDLREAFAGMNRAMHISARGKYDSWRPFQLAFLLANLQCLVEPRDDAAVVDVVWFATGGGKTETYLGLLITAALLDRMRGKISGITAWSRFPLRLLSLQQTQRFANALAAAEIVRREMRLGGDPFSLGFLVGGSATPNRIKKDAARESEWDVDKVEDIDNPFRLLDTCPFCRERSVTTRFDRSTWRLVHRCDHEPCPTNGEPIPLYVIDDEIWRFLPTIVVGTLDKAANISRQPGMRGLVGAPWGMCSKPGHGYTFARRSDRPNGCLVPDCTGGKPAHLPMDATLYAPSFRLQDELHLLRDSLGAVDAHYEAALDGLQFSLSGTRPKVLASSATLTGYEKQIGVLYNRAARVFPQPPPRAGEGFWTSDSDKLMRRYVALAPRRLTVEFVVDRLIVTLQRSVRRLLDDPASVSQELSIDPRFADFLVNLYGTNVVYGNTLQDIDAVIRSSETQYAGVSPSPNIETLTGRTDFENVRRTLDRLENPEPEFDKRLHIIAASSMMSHGVDIDRLNVMVMLAFPLGVAEFIQATARVGRRWPALVIVVPKMTRERDASIYRAFPTFVSHGDRFVEPIPITRRSRRVLERTAAGIEFSRILLLHEPDAPTSLVTPKQLNTYLRDHPDLLDRDREAILQDLGIGSEDPFLQDQLRVWFDAFARNLREPPADARFLSHLSPTGEPMLSLRDVEEQAPVAGDST
jgi:hypothetical protein